MSSDGTPPQEVEDETLHLETANEASDLEVTYLLNCSYNPNGRTVKNISQFGNSFQQIVLDLLLEGLEDQLGLADDGQLLESLRNYPSAA